MRKPRGVVLYDGPSLLDGEPIICVATFRTRNPKTGNAIQTWIIRKDVNPIAAINDGLDQSVCGDCPLRGIIVNNVNKGRTCYVAVQNAPGNVYQGYYNGSYPVYDSVNHLQYFNRPLRLGSYGEITAVPYRSISHLIKNVPSVMGYTHQWRQGRFYRWKRHLMASVQSENERLEAIKRGWRTYRIRLANQPLMAGEFICPASSEGGARMDCVRCGACNGGRPEQASPVIIAHGAPNKRANIKDVLDG